MLRKYWKPAVIVLAALALAVGVGIWARNRWISNPSSTLQNQGYTDKELEAEARSGKASVSDEEKLRKLLLREEEITITVANDIEIREELVVNGKKTLKGDARLKMWLAALDEQALLSVPGGASLTVNQLMLDGNGISDGIRVEEDGELIFADGQIEYSAEYGVRSKGVAKLSNVTMENVLFCGAFAENGGKLYLEDCSIKDAKQSFVHVEKGGYAEVTGEGTYENCIARSFSNEGTLVVNGESSTKEEKQPIRLVNTYFGFHNQGDGNLTVNGISVENSERSGIYSSGGEVNVSNSFFKGQKNAALQVGVEAVMNIENVTVRECESAAVFTSDDTKVTIKGSLFDTCRRGVYDDSNVSMINTTVQNIDGIGEGVGVFVSEKGVFKMDGGVLIHCVTTNAGGGFYLKGGKATLNKVTFKNNESNAAGAAIRVNAGTLSVDGAIFDGNRSVNSSGGGVTVEGSTVTIKNSKFKNNKALNDGGALHVANTAARVTVANCEFTANTATGSEYSAGGAIIATMGNVTVSNSTFTNNKADYLGGAVENREGAFVATNCSFKNNRASKGGAVSQNGKGSTSLKADTKKKGIISGNTAVLKKDSMGGALYQNNGKLTVDGYRITDSKANSAGGALYLFNANATITNTEITNSTSGSAGAAIRLVAGSLKVNDSLLAKNSSPSNSGGAITVEGAALQMKNTRLEENLAKIDGGALHIANEQAEVSLDACTFKNNSALGSDYSSGGAIIATMGNCTVKNSIFENNTAGYIGGAVENRAGAFVAKNCIFKSNTSENGGAVSQNGTGSLVLSSTGGDKGTLEGNKARGNFGGAAYLAHQGALTIDGYQLAGNEAKSAGGAVYVVEGTMKIANSDLLENISDRAGAAVRIEKGTLTVDNSTFSGNKSVNSSGGAITVVSATATLTNSIFAENTVKETGGALHIADPAAKVSLNRCTIERNTSQGAGGAMYIAAGEVHMMSSTIKANQSNSAGAGIRLVEGSLTADHCVFEGNQSPSSSGGAITIQNGIVSLNQTVFKENTAKANGGALHIANAAANVAVNSCTFEKNTVQERGGAIYVDSGALSLAKAQGAASGTVFKDNNAGIQGKSIFAAGAQTFAMSDCEFVNNGEVRLGANANAEISGSLAGVNFTSGKTTAFIALSAAVLEDDANVITVTPDNYTIGNVILTKKEGVTDAEWKYAYEHIRVAPKGEDANWYIDASGTLQNYVAGNVASVTTATGTQYYPTFTEAIAAANASGGTGTAEAVVVTILNDVTVSAQIDIQKNIIIQNLENKDVKFTRASNYAGNMFDINVDNVTFTLGRMEDNASGSLTVDATSSAAIGARTVFNHKGTATFILGKNATLTGAKATGAGAVLANAGTAKLYGNMTNNSSNSHGGAINNIEKGQLYVYAGNYTNNTALNNNGGAIYVGAFGNIYISGGTFSGNRAGKGGAVYCEYAATTGTKLNISGGTFTDNEATTNSAGGGAVQIFQTNGNISGGTFTGNTATFRGGAVQADGNNGTCVLTVTGGTFKENVSRNQGGAAFSLLKTTASISGVTIQDNVCLNKDTSTYMGGAILIQEKTTATLSNCVINGNTTVGEGTGATQTGFDIGFRGQSNAKLVLADNSFNGLIGWKFGDTAVSVQIGNETPITLAKGNIYSVDYAGKTLTVH